MVGPKNQMIVRINNPAFTSVAISFQVLSATKQIKKSEFQGVLLFIPLIKCYFFTLIICCPT
jgi:hypothetical protein